MFNQHGKNILKFLGRIAFVGSSFLTAIFSFLLLSNTNNVGATGKHTGILLKDIKIDEYGRTVMKHQVNAQLNIADENAPDLICPCPDPPPPPDPVPDLICPCPDPPPPPS